MGVGSKLRDMRPPLPAPTESMDEGGTSGIETDVATNLTSRTDKTSYEVPEDGSPITISTQKVTGAKKNSMGLHQRQKSQTSLLIEYFEAAKTGDKSKSRPSVRVKVTPSSRKKSGGHDAVQITGIGKDRKPSYSRRISLGSSKNADVGPVPAGDTEFSHSSGGSNVSGRSPIEVEVLHPTGSDMSTASRGLEYAPHESNVSSMPPDSMLEGSSVTETARSQTLTRDEELATHDEDYLQAPKRTRSRSTSRDRIAQRVMEKLGQSSQPRKSSKSRSERSYSYDRNGEPHERRRRSSKGNSYEEDSYSGAESSLLSSNLVPAQKSYQSTSDVSKASRMTNNPKLLEMVEDTIKRMILPEINAIKEDQKADRNQRSFEGSSSYRHDTLPKDGLQRRVSKSSSSPNISSKPKVVLNRDANDPGTVLSRGDSERKTRKSSHEHRPSSRRSSGQHSSHSDHYDDETVRKKSSRSSHKLRDAAAAGVAGGALTSAALKHHDSQDDVHYRRKRRSKSRSSRSRSASITETAEDDYAWQKNIPPMPMASHINDSDITRESIMSVDTERSPSQPAAINTPNREVSRGSLKAAVAPDSPRSPARSPNSRSLGMSLGNASIESAKTPNGNLSTRSRFTTLSAAAGAAAATPGLDDGYERHVDADGYGGTPPRKTASPVQSVSSIKKNFEDEPLIPGELRPRSAASRSSAGLREQAASRSSMHSGFSSPTTRLARSQKQSQDISVDQYTTSREPRSEGAALRDGRSPLGTPTRGESVDDWYERQHQLNDQYRESMVGEPTNHGSMATTNNRESYQTNPYPEDEKRFTQFTDDSQQQSPRRSDDEQDVRGLGANPRLVHTSHGAESAVASLLEPSNLSSNVVSQDSDGSARGGSYSERMASHLRDMGKDGPAIYEGSTLSQTMPSRERWAALKGHAREMSSSSKDDIRALDSPSQSPAKSLHGERSLEQQPVMSASGMPVAGDPLPEIGHFDDSKSDLTTNPSIIQGPLGGDASGKDPWPYTPEPEHKEYGTRDATSLKSNRSKIGEFSTGEEQIAAAEGGATALATAYNMKLPAVEDEDAHLHRLTPDLGRGKQSNDREATPTSPAAFRDEGYVTDVRTGSRGGRTPRAEQQQYSRSDLDEFDRAMNAQDPGDDDPFVGNANHARHVSGNSHGMSSPLYDSATGKGKDHIQSKDVVALMDHLTVRDAQRNARDTEILVTLVRSAAEMRQSFDEMKRFIVEQDRMIMQNTDRGTDQTIQKVLSGPRPQPTSSPRTPRRQSEEDIQTKRKGVLRRALRGLTGGKNHNDLTKVEDMLMQILDNVEALKHQNPPQRATEPSSTDTLDSYEKLRNAPDSGYEPEGQADTSSTPSQSGNLSTTPRAEKQQFHSGYDGRRGSATRVSTVLEDDEDGDLEPHEDLVLNHQFENNERLLTPTQELTRNRGFDTSRTPPQHAATFNGAQPNELTPRSTDKQHKHKSNGSSNFGVPKISRWSKTTASSGAPDPATLDSPNVARSQRPLSEASGSGSSLDQYDDERLELHDQPSRSLHSLADEYDTQKTSRTPQASGIAREPSPLIPSEASMKSAEYEAERAHSPGQQDVLFDDPKYQAHRNSLLLQHPQPRQGPTPRHQNTLESQAHDFDDASGTNSDISQRTVSDFDPATWGSSGTAGLAKHRLSQLEPLSPVSMNSPRVYGGAGSGKNDPLVPQRKPVMQPKSRYEEPEQEPEPDVEREPQYSNSGFSLGGYYSSPFGSGHLLEPIEEVRYSLETDSGHISPEPEATPAKSTFMRSSGRKITGPRPMGSRSPQPKAVEYSGTVRRKPMSRARGSIESFESESETF